MLVEVNAPQEYQGGVMSGLTKRHAIVTGTDANEGYFTIYCEVSWAERIIHYLQTEEVEMVSKMIWFLSKMMLLFTLRKQVLTQEKIWDEEEEGKNDESNNTNNKHTKKELHLKHSQQSGDIVLTKWTWILSCRTATVAVYVNSDPNLCILRPNYCLWTRILNCRTATVAVYVNSDPNLCILRPNSASTQTQICVYSDPTLYQLRPNSVSTQTKICTKSELRSCVKAEVDVPHLYNSHYGLLDVKQHLKREEKKYIYINSEKSRAFISKISLLYRVSLICSLASEDIKQKDS